MDLKDMARRLGSANTTAEAALNVIRENPAAGKAVTEDSLRNYIACKLLLEEDEISDNIVEMTRINIAKASHIPIEQLVEMDKPGRCGSAPAVLAKRVMLYIGIQKELGITFPVQEMADIRKISELADMVCRLQLSEQESGTTIPC